MSLESLEAVNEEYASAKQQFTERISAAMKSAFQKMFDKEPALQSFSWVQYTPYFNDGEPCKFGVNDDVYYIDINDVNCEDHFSYERYDPEQNRDVYNINPDLPEEWKGLKSPTKIVGAIQQILRTVDNEVLQALGEGKIIFDRDGSVEADYYEHE